MSSKQTRLKRLHRRQGTAQPAAPLAPHTDRCECTACEKKAQTAITRAKKPHEQRLGRNHGGARDAELRSDWHVSLHHLVTFFDMHDVTFKKRHVTHVDLRAEWLSYLSARGPHGPIDDSVLYDAFFVLEHITPLHGRLLRGWRGGQGQTQAALAEEECMSRQAVQRALDAAEDSLEDLYRALLAREQARLVEAG